MAENYSLVLLGLDINETNENYQNILEEHRNVVHDINIFTDLDECVDFLTDLVDLVAVLIIVDDIISQQTMPLIHDIPQLDRIYVFSWSEWFNEWPKVQEMHTTMTEECEGSELAIEKDHHDSIAMSFIPMDENDFDRARDELETSFMYTQVLREIHLDMKYDQKSIENFAAFCRIGNYSTSNNIDQFAKEYHSRSPIWWYTFLPFIYSMLNFALRELKVDIIIKMGFFICDLHNQIKQLHSEQLERFGAKRFILYRGQGLLHTDFEQLLEAKGGLMSFNNFLSTSRNEIVSIGFAQAAVSGTDKIAVLFRMTIDPLILSSPFADIQGISSFASEEEVLFSMHTVFHIGEIKLINDDSVFYQVELELTADDDEQLRILTKHMENDSRSDPGWKRLSNLLFKIDQYDQIEELYTEIPEETLSDHDKIYYYGHLSQVKLKQGAHEAAIKYILEGSKSYKKTLSVNNSSSITTDDSVAFYSYKTGDESKALWFSRNSPSIDEESLLDDHLSPTTCYNHADEVNASRRQHSNAVFYEKSLESFQKSLALEHPSLATFNNKIVGIFDDIDEKSKPLLFCEKMLEIRQQVLPPDHRDLATSYYSIATIYQDRNEHSKALSLYENSLRILEKSCPINHPDLATIYRKMGDVYEHMEEYSKALLFLKKALKIWQRSLPVDHPCLTNTYDHVASLYKQKGEYTKAVYFYEKTLKILERIPNENGPELVRSYNNIGAIYFRMAEYTKALHFHEKELAINQEKQPSDYLALTSSYNNIGSIYIATGNYPKALSYFQLALDASKFASNINDTQRKIFQENITIIQEKIDAEFPE